MKKPEGSLISYFSNLVKRDGGINLAQGRPGFAPPDELMAILADKAPNPDLHQYAPGNGNFKLIELLTEEYSRLHPINPDNFLIVNGATEGIFLVFYYLSRLIGRSFSVLSFDPVYESYSGLPVIFGLPFEYFDYEKNLSVNFDRLESVIKERNVKIVFLASPGNPLGKVWAPAEIESIMTLADKHDFYLIFDAVYKDIYFSRRPSSPVAMFKPNLFYVASFSKMLGITGWRIGYIIAEENHMRRIRDIHDYTGVCAPSILQAAIAEYLDKYGFGDKYLKQIRKKCKASYTHLKKVLLRLKFHVPNIKGGYFVWARLPKEYQDGYEFACDLYKAVKVGVVPGENFSRTKSSYLRLNFATELSIIEEAAERMSRFIQSTGE